MRISDWSSDVCSSDLEAMGWEYVIPRRDRTGLGEVKGADMGTKYFVEAVRREVASRYGADTLYGGGLRIYTTPDFAMHAAAWKAVRSTPDQPGHPAAAGVAVPECRPLPTARNGAGRGKQVA